MFLIWGGLDLAVYSEQQSGQNSSALEHLCWSTPAYSVFGGGVDRTIKTKQDDGALPACCTSIFVLVDLLQSTPKCPVLLVLTGCSGIFRVL